MRYNIIAYTATGREVIVSSHYSKEYANRVAHSLAGIMSKETPIYIDGEKIQNNLIIKEI